MYAFNRLLSIRSLVFVSDRLPVASDWNQKSKPADKFTCRFANGTKRKNRDGTKMHWGNCRSQIETPKILPHRIICCCCCFAVLHRRSLVALAEVCGRMEGKNILPLIPNQHCIETLMRFGFLAHFFVGAIFTHAFYYSCDIFLLLLSDRYYFFSALLCFSRLSATLLHIKDHKQSLIYTYTYSISLYTRTHTLYTHMHGRNDGDDCLTILL